MKNPYHLLGKYLLAFSLLICPSVFILVSCSKLSLKGIFSEVNEEEPIIKEARASFEMECTRLSSIMTKGATLKNEFRFQLGTIVPDWESTGYSIEKDGSKESLDVRVPEYTYSYRSYSLEDGADSSSFVKWYHKLVYVHDIETDESNCYIVFYIPTQEYSSSHRFNISHSFLNMDSQEDYEGLKIWTLLDGTVIRVNKYSEGKKIAGVSMVGVQNVQDYLSRINCAMKLMGKMKIERGEGHRSRLTKSLPEEWGEDYYIYYLILQGGVIIYFDGSFVYLDTDGDGIPDEIVGVIEPSIIIEYMSGDGGDSGNPDPDPDPDPSGGNGDPEGGGGGSGNNPGPIPPPSNLSVVSIAVQNYTYLGYISGDETHNCNAISRDLLRQSGVIPAGGFSPGGTPPTGCHVLFYEDNTFGHSLIRTSDSIENAIVYFQNQLLLGHLVMVGVDYEGNKGYNDGTVDHFVVLSGYGFDGDGNLYFEYVDTNRSASNYQYCYGDDFRFNYDSQERILIATRYTRYENGLSDGEYTITQYRENTDL